MRPQTKKHLPDLGHIIPAQTTLSEDFLRNFPRDEAAAGLIPGPEDLVVVLLLVLCENPRNLGRLDGFVLGHLHNRIYSERRESR